MSDGSTARMLHDIQHKSLSSIERLNGAMRSQPANVQAAFMNARDILQASAAARGRQGMPRSQSRAVNNYYFNTRPTWSPYAHFYTAPLYPRVHDPYFSNLPPRRGAAKRHQKRTGGKRKGAKRGRKGTRKRSRVMI